MDQLTIVATEDGGLVLAAESGQRFVLPIDDVLRTELRRADRAVRRESMPATQPSPREIQAQIRSGLSAEQVAELVGASVEDIRRFEGPVLAEREHIVERALAVPVLMGVQLDPESQPTFGTAVRGKLTELLAHGERWTSWKDDTGWIIKLEFTSNDVDHDARWSFDPRRSALAPLNGDATQLSRQGSLPEGLIPRLRAVDHAGTGDRFDSGAFGPRSVPEPEDDAAADGFARAVTPPVTAIEPSDGEVPHRDTADLLEALRRRRGQRTAAPVGDDDDAEPIAPRPAAAPVSLFELDDEPADEPTDEVEDSEPVTHDPVRRRSGRTSMPSWDEIVFGARTDE